MRRRFVCLLIVVTVLGWMLPLGEPARATTCPLTTYLGDNPSDVSPGWTDNNQGIAHDAGHWFFTSDEWLLKIPLSVAVDADIDPEDSESWPSGVKVVGIPQSLADAGWNHFGDLDQHGGFLYIPMTGEDDDENSLTAIAVFDASTLGYVGMKQNPGGSLAWVGFNPADGFLYSSGSTTSLRRYSVDVSKFPDVETAIQNVAPDLQLFEADGSGLERDFEYLQGGTFTPWGDLYLVNGFPSDDPFNNDLYSQETTRGGVHRFHLDTDGKWKVEEESTNGSGAFNFAYDPDFGYADEPEGADWFSLDGVSNASGITGKLHVMLNDNDGFPGNDDDLYLKHYDVDYWCKAGADTDNDGLEDFQEAYSLGTSPVQNDSDFDGIHDGDEINVFGTDPLDPDSDHDGIEDGEEDTDFDGLTNAQELYGFGTNPFIADTDGDGINDGLEVSMLTDPNDTDSDDDGLDDGLEVNTHGTNPLDADTDDDGLNDGQEITYGTNPLDEDSDNDGLLDGEDVEFIQTAVQALPASTFSSAGGKNAIVQQLDSIEKMLAKGQMDQALQQLLQLRARLDGCGSAADGNDWIVNCADQVQVRALVDQLYKNLST
jgi:hypothetical protein